MKNCLQSLFPFHLNDHHVTMNRGQIQPFQQYSDDPHDVRKRGQKPSHLGNGISGQKNVIDLTFRHSGGMF